MCVCVCRTYIHTSGIQTQMLTEKWIALDLFMCIYLGPVFLLVVFNAQCTAYSAQCTTYPLYYVHTVPRTPCDEALGVCGCVRWLKVIRKIPGVPDLIHRTCIRGCFYISSSYSYTLYLPSHGFLAEHNSCCAGIRKVNSLTRENYDNK